ncbi:MAG: cupin domain-containing protein [Burkholderiales bacterium]|nr:cupin domain-containing protein [Burkholderiales bacterium]
MKPSIQRSQVLIPSKRVAPVPAALFAALMAITGIAFSEALGPTVAKGASTKALGSIDLSTEIDGLSGRQLRARLVAIEPGGHLAAHSHRDRPTMEYVVQGNVIEIRNGVEIPHGPGEMVIATREVSHWWENRGTTTVLLLPVDIFKP